MSKKTQEAFEEWAENSGQLMNFSKWNCGWYLSARTNSAWNAWQAATAATQRDAMAVAEEIASKCGDVIREFKEIAISYNDTRSKEIANHLLSLLCQKIDLAAIVAIVEAVRPGQQNPANQQLLELARETTHTYAGHTLAEIKAAAHSTDDIIRSHGWDGTVEMGDHMGKDEAFMKLASPATVLAMALRIDELEQQLVRANADSTSSLRLVAEVRHACGDDGKRMTDELVQYVGGLAKDAWRYRAMQPPAEWKQLTVERCEAGLPECGPVTRHDAEGVPLCRACWEALMIETDPLSDETEWPHPDGFAGGLTERNHDGQD